MNVAFILNTIKARTFKHCMIITLLGVYVFIVGLMTLTLLQVHRCVRDMKKVLILPFRFFILVYILVYCSVYFSKIIHSMNCVTVVCSREISYMFLVSQVSGLVENFTIGIFSDTTNVINVKRCLMVLHTELYLFITLSVTLRLFQGHRSVNQI